MKALSLVILSGLVAVISAIPITPSAPEHQRLAERLRSEGLPERDIAEQLSLPVAEASSRPLYSQAIDKLSSLLYFQSELMKRDLSGDLAPGSLEAPQMLPRAAAPESLADTISQVIEALLRGEDLEKRKFGYEGKESELRRPEGMRHWG